MLMSPDRVLRARFSLRRTGCEESLPTVVETGSPLTRASACARTCIKPEAAPRLHHSKPLCGCDDLQVRSDGGQQYPRSQAGSESPTHGDEPGANFGFSAPVPTGRAHFEPVPFKLASLSLSCENLPSLPPLQTPRRDSATLERGEQRRGVRHSY